MKRLWRVPEAKRLLQILSPKTNPLKFRQIQAQPGPCPSGGLSGLIGLFPGDRGNGDCKYWDDLRAEVALLRMELVDRAEVEKVLENKGVGLFMKHYTGAGFVELMKQLKPWPDLALEVVWFISFFLFVLFTNTLPAY